MGSGFVGASPGANSQPPQPPSGQNSAAPEEVAEVKEVAVPSFAIDDEPPSPLPQIAAPAPSQQQTDLSLDLDESLGLEGLDLGEEPATSAVEETDKGQNQATTSSPSTNTPMHHQQPIHLIHPMTVQPPAQQAPPTTELGFNTLLTAESLATADSQFAQPPIASKTGGKSSEDWLLDELEKQLSPASSDFSSGVDVNLDNLEIEDSWDDMNDLKEMMEGIESDKASKAVEDI
jgi:hypothetical protein